jgi:hypothetical protein
MFLEVAAGVAADYTARTGDGIPPLTAALADDAYTQQPI